MLAIIILYPRISYGSVISIIIIIIIMYQLSDGNANFKKYTNKGLN